MRKFLLRPMRTALFFWAALLLTVVSVYAEPEGSSAHYVVFKLSATGDLIPQFYKQVLLAAPVQGKTAEQLLALRRERRQGAEMLEFQLIDSSGHPVFQDAVWLPLWIRGEFHHEPQAGTAWDIDPHFFRDPEPVFVLRLPVIQGASLVFPGKPGQRFALDRMADLVAGAPEPGLLSSTATPIGPTGNPANRVDMLVMGDGYRSAEATKFTTDATNLVNQFFSITPYAEYRNFVNVSLLFTPSAESEADHPPYESSCGPGDDPTCCSDSKMQADSRKGQFVSTVFNGRYCAFQIHRLAVVDNSLVYMAAASVPDWDVILVLLNDPTYGGSGGAIPVSSTHPQATDIARHEYGHSFTLLADEYETPFPGYPLCSDIFGPACEPNVTDHTMRELIKWLPWIPAAVPVPTPESNPYLTGEGLFEGARYRASGMYRHTHRECLMNLLGKPFGAVCRQAYVLRLYQGGWGNPSSGIELIEPGTASPISSTVNFFTSRTFSIGVLRPIGGAPSVQWYVNRSAVAGATGSSFLFAPAALGTYEVAVRLRDTTPLVNAIMGGTIVETTRIWIATRIDAASIFHDGFERGDTSAWVIDVLQREP